MLKIFINNLNIKFLTIQKHIYILNIKIPDFKNNINSFKVDKNLLIKL